jgi:hypothetical protein
VRDRDPATLDELVAAARRDGPSSATLSRLADEAATRSPATGHRSFLRNVPWSRAAIVLAAVAVAGVAVGTSMRSLETQSQPSATAPENALPTSSTAAASTARPLAASANATAGQPPEVPTIDVRALPESKTRRSAPDAVKPAASSQETTEGALLHAAHAAIADNPSRALALTAEHVRRFPSGMLVQEREVIAVEALARLGRAGEARARAAAFFATYPSSAYRHRVDDALGSSTSSPAGPR